MFSNREEELSNLQTYIKDVDYEITMILQNLQWDRSTLLAEKPTVPCALNATHILLSDKKETHEKQCWLKSQGYRADDKMLPEPLDSNANTVVKFCSEDIRLIVECASKNDPSFKKVIENPVQSSNSISLLGNGWSYPIPLTLERAQATYTVDERRAIHDAVVASVPTCHDLSDLALLDVNAVKLESKTKSRMEILAELRDMKRRRTKYRVATKTKNYSDVLRDVIKTQMEVYTGTPEESQHNADLNRQSEPTRSDNNPKDQTQIKRKSSSIQRYKYNDTQKHRDDLQESRFHYYENRRKNNSREPYERDSSRNDDRGKHHEKEKMDYKRDSTTFSERKIRSEHEQRNEKKSNNRVYNEKDNDEYHERRSKRQSKYNERENDKYRNYERPKSYDGARRQTREKYNRERQRHDVRNEGHETKYDSRTRNYHEDRRYRTSDEIKIKQEIYSDHYDGYKRSGNSLDDYNRRVRVKRETDIDKME